MIQKRIELFAARIVTLMAENRRRAQHHNREYLEFWRSQLGA